MSTYYEWVAVFGDGDEFEGMGGDSRQHLVEALNTAVRRLSGEVPEHHTAVVRLQRAWTDSDGSRITDDADFYDFQRYSKAPTVHRENLSPSEFWDTGRKVPQKYLRMAAFVERTA